MGYHLNRLDEPVFIEVSKPLLTEFGIHYRLESCDPMMKHLDPTPLKRLTKGPQTSITRPGFSCVFRSVIWMTIHCYTCAPPTALSQLPTSSCHIAVAVVTILPKLQMCHTCVTSQTAKVTLPSTQLPVGVLVEWQGPFWTRELTPMSNHTQGENTSTHHSLHITLSHLAKRLSDLKQNGTQAKTPFSGTVFHTLSHGVLRFVASVSFKNH